MRLVIAETWASCKKYVVQYVCPLCFLSKTIFVDDKKNKAVKCCNCYTKLKITSPT